ncbi:MAG: Trp family transcriptional regulator [Patescibacteria group bacterium]
MKVRPRKLNKEDKIKYLDALYTAIATLKSRDNIKMFLRDLLTESERIMIGRRIIIAQRLLEDKTYIEIRQELSVGVDTIMRVHKWLEDENYGYEETIKKLEKEYKNRKRWDDKNPGTSEFARLKRRYPLHFFLFNLFDELNKK